MRVQMDTSLPAVKRIMDLHREFVGEYLRTHTPEQVQAMLAKIERDRVIRQRMFAGRVHPVTQEHAAG